MKNYECNKYYCCWFCFLSLSVTVLTLPPAATLLEYKVLVYHIYHHDCTAVCPVARSTMIEFQRRLFIQFHFEIHSFSAFLSPGRYFDRCALDISLFVSCHSPYTHIVYHCVYHAVFFIYVCLFIRSLSLSHCLFKFIFWLSRASPLNWSSDRTIWCLVSVFGLLD